MRLDIPVAFLIILCFISPAFAQPSLDWVHTYASTGNNQNIWDVETNPQGHVVWVGHFTDTIDLDPGTGVDQHISAGGPDVMICKADLAGNLIWARSFGSTGTQVAHEVDFDTAGNIYVSGFFQGVVDFDPGAGVTLDSSHSNSADIFVVRLDPNGNFDWVYTAGGDGSERTMNLRVFPTGDVYVCGFFSDSAEFEPGAPWEQAADLRDGYVLKLNTSGVLQWVHTVGGIGFDYIYDVTLDDTGNYYLAGEFRTSLDIDLTAGVQLVTATPSSGDMFISKNAPNNNLIWYRHIGGTGQQSPQSMDLAPNGDLVLGGLVSGSADFDPGAGVTTLSSNGARDGFFLRLTNNGDFLWASSIGSSGNEYTEETIVDGAGNLYAVGWIAGSADMDPGPGVLNRSLSDGSTWVMKLDQQGDLEWVENLGSTGGTGQPQGLELGSNGDIFHSSQFTGTVDLAPGLAGFPVTSSGTNDTYVARWYYCTSTSASLSLNGCPPYLSPSGNYTWTTSGTYQDTVVNAQGCDSLLTITLTLAPGTSDTVTAQACGQYTSAGGNVLTSSGTYTDTLTNQAGCDSLITLHLTLGQSTFSSINDTGCNTYTTPDGITHFSSGTWSDSLTSAAGCDSVVEIHYEIADVNTQISVAPGNTALQAQATNATYQWIDCELMVPISGQTNSTFPLTQTGFYAVAVTQNGCTDTSVCITYIGVGVAEAGLEDCPPAVLFPNPSDGQFSIDQGSDHPGTIRIYSAIGALVHSGPIGNGQGGIDLRQFGAGIYFAHVERDGCVTRQRLVVR